MENEYWCGYCKIFEKTEVCDYKQRREQEGRDIPPKKKPETLDGMTTKDGVDN